jgi:hypothetical protein
VLSKGPPNDTLKLAAPVSPTIQRDGATCVVVLWRIPETPGGFRVVTVGNSNKVLRVEPGK